MDNGVMGAHLRVIADDLEDFMNAPGGLMLPDDKPDNFDRDMERLRRIADILEKRGENVAD